MFRFRERLSQCDVEVRRGPHKLRPAIRWCLAHLLKWFDAYPNHLATLNTMQYIEVKEKSFFDGLRLTTQDLDRIWDGGFRLYVGPDAFGTIVDEFMYITSPFNFNLDVELWRDRFDGMKSIKMCGVPITFVPWLEGHVLLPKVNDESSSGPGRSSGGFRHRGL